MKINLLYIIFQGVNDSSGISKKIKAQVKAFKNLGIKTAFSYLSTDRNNKYDGRLINGEMLERYETKFGIDKRWKWKYKFKKLIEYIREQKIKLIYIRYNYFANPFFMQFLKKAKRMDVYIVMEIPTYPYDAEQKNPKFQHKIIKRIEEFYRQYFHKYVDLIVTYSNEKKIFHVKTIEINNGIDLDTINLKKFSNNKNGIYLIAMAMISFWHGYDRLIEGLRNYYANNPQLFVYLQLVGDSDDKESQKYKMLVKKYNLGNCVNFNGIKNGKELDELFDNSDLAIGSLGRHRTDITYIKSLKNSEYCARGIPFIYSEIDDSFEDKPFILKVPPDDSPIDINNLITFINSKKFEPREIRKFAEENLTWDIQIEIIIDAIVKSHPAILSV